MHADRDGWNEKTVFIVDAFHAFDDHGSDCVEVDWLICRGAGFDLVEDPLPPREHCYPIVTLPLKHPLRRRKIAKSRAKFQQLPASKRHVSALLFAPRFAVDFQHA
jgi:hypothetical protein